MQGDPCYFESFLTRLGFQTEEATGEHVSLVWRGARFPGFICLGTAAALLFLSVPVIEAIRSQGWGGTAASLWYFPAMNLFLVCAAVFLLSLKRCIRVDRRSCRVLISKRSLWRRRELVVNFTEIGALKVGTDMVYSGLALAGSTTGQRFFPATSLRLVLISGDTVLLDRGTKNRVLALAIRLEQIIKKPMIDSEKNTSHN